MVKRRLAYVVAACLMASSGLSACGEGSGWEMQLTNTAFPYGNQRTAGSGVMYVRAKLLPEKALSLENVQRDMAPQPTPAPAPHAVEQKLEKALQK